MCETSKKQLKDITPEGCLVQSSGCFPAAFSPGPNKIGVSEPGCSEAPSLEEGDMKVAAMWKKGPVHESAHPCSDSEEVGSDSQHNSQAVGRSHSGLLPRRLTARPVFVSYV